MGKVYESPPSLATQPYILIDENDPGRTRAAGTHQAPTTSGNARALTSGGVAD